MKTCLEYKYLAWQAAKVGDFLAASEQLEKALSVYPSAVAQTEIGQRDIAYLKNKIEQFSQFPYPLSREA